MIVPWVVEDFSAPETHPLAQLRYGIGDKSEQHAYIPKPDVPSKDFPCWLVPCGLRFKHVKRAGYDKALNIMLISFRSDSDGYQLVPDPPTYEVSFRSCNQNPEQ